MKSRILIIEEDTQIVESIHFAFKIYWPAAELVIAKTSEKGIEYAHTEGIAAIILDIDFHDGNGYQVLQQIRNCAVVPIVVVTLLSEESDIIRGLDIGADEYITKPFSYQALLARVKAMIRREKQLTSQKIKRK